LLQQARRLTQDQEQISASYLQRKLQVGYPRAARLKELLDTERQADEDKEPPEEPAANGSGGEAGGAT